jgi:hypothetical protein
VVDELLTNRRWGAPDAGFFYPYGYLYFVNWSLHLSGSSGVGREFYALFVAW